MLARLHATVLVFALTGAAVAQDGGSAPGAPEPAQPPQPAQSPTPVPDAPEPASAPALQAARAALNFMHTTNQVEIRAAELVLERTETEIVRRFADRLLRDHRLSDQMLSKLADDKGIVLTPAGLPGGAESGALADREEASADWEDRDEIDAEADDELPDRDPPGLLLPREARGRGVDGGVGEDSGRTATERRPGGQRVAGIDPGDLPQIIEPPEASDVIGFDGARPAEAAGAPGQRDQSDQGDQPDRSQDPLRQPRDVAGPGGAATRGVEAGRPPGLEEARQRGSRMLRNLEAAQGADVDAEYVAAMIRSHEQAIMELRAALQGLEDPEVQDLVESLIPILEQHERLARHVQQELRGEPLATLEGRG